MHRKDVPGYNGKYQVDEEGRLYNTNYHRKGITREIEGTVNSIGYRVASLTLPKHKATVEYFHKLIWVTFRGEYGNGLVIDHINEDKLDNRLSNLRLLERGDNAFRGVSYKRSLTKKEYEEVYRLAQEGLITQKEIGKMYGISGSSVGDIKYGRIKYRFRVPCTPIK